MKSPYRNPQLFILLDHSLVHEEPIEEQCNDLRVASDVLARAYAELPLALRQNLGPLVATLRRPTQEEIARLGQEDAK